jgi:hypothetical protein
MRADERGLMLDAGLTALALRGLHQPASYPFLARYRWRRRARGLGTAVMACLKKASAPGADSRRTRHVPLTSDVCPVCLQSLSTDGLVGPLRTLLARKTGRGAPATNGGTQRRS